MFRMSVKKDVFVAKCMQGTDLRKVVDAAKEVIVDGLRDCTKTGMSLQSMDVFHVCLVHVWLESAGFEVYDCEEDVSVGICLKR